MTALRARAWGGAVLSGLVGAACGAESSPLLPPSNPPPVPRFVYQTPESDIFVKALNSVATEVAGGVGIDTDPDVSPDGRTVAFASGRGGASLEIWLANLDSPGLSDRGPGRQPDWSPDGERLAITGRGPTGRDEVCVITRFGADLGCLALGTRPAWSPDATRIAFQRLSTGNHYDVWVMDSDGQNEMNLTSTPDVNETGPAWSPDGQEIAFGRQDHGLWLMSPDGGNQRRLTRVCLDARDPDWSPDGSRIVFATCGGTAPQIRIIDLATLEVQNVTLGFQPSWVP